MVGRQGGGIGRVSGGIEVAHQYCIAGQKALQFRDKGHTLLGYIGTIK
jgi:hypothetical protein